MSQAANAAGAPGTHSGGAPDEPTAGLGPLRRTVREVGWGLITVGVIIFLFAAYELLGTNVTAAHRQSSLSRQFSQALHRELQQAKRADQHRHVTSTTAPSTPPTTVAPNPSVPLGGAIDHLVIPAIGVNRYVVQGTGVAQLQEGPGHYTGTALPGQTGNVAIAGHRTTFGAPFFELNELKAGDEIELTDLADRTWVYKVTGQEVVSPTDVSVIAPTKTARLTLTTCTPRYWATDRLVVVASLVGRRRLPPTQTQTTSPHISVLPGDGTKAHAHSTKHHAAAAPPTRLGSGDGNAWPGAVGFGLLVVAGWIAVRLLAARSRRWQRAAVFAAGIVVCAVPLWFAFASVVRLLPSNL